MEAVIILGFEVDGENFFGGILKREFSHLFNLHFKRKLHKKYTFSTIFMRKYH
jgi:hypothetical protein